MISRYPLAVHISMAFFASLRQIQLIPLSLTFFSKTDLSDAARIPPVGTRALCPIHPYWFFILAVAV